MYNGLKTYSQYIKYAINNVNNHNVTIFSRRRKYNIHFAVFNTNNETNHNQGELIAKELIRVT